MKKTKNYKFWSGLLPLLFLMLSVAMQAQSFLINFPAFSSSPTKNPQDITVCNGTSKLQVQMSAGASSASGAEVTIQLAAGIEYVAGSATVVSSNAGLTITENGGTANAPKFKIANASGAIANSDNIVFTIDRRATCTARTEVINGTVFKDTVTGTIPGSTASTELSGSYDVKYAVLSFTQPSTQNNAIVGQSYTRIFSITNGGSGSISEVYLALNNTGLTTNTLTLTGGTGSTGTPIVLTPTSTVGTTSYYTIPASQLSGGNLDSGENLTFSENFKVLSCTGSTAYSVGWGCSAAPSAWCATKTATGGVASATGVPNIGLAFTRVSTGDFCTGDKWRYTYTNNGTQNTPGAGAATNIIAQLGTSNWTAPQGVNIDAGHVFLTNFTINGVSITATQNTGGGYVLDLSQLTSAPSGSGLVDSDGDGQFDDLPIGASFRIDYELKWKPTGNIFNSCNSSNLDVTPNARIDYKNLCGTAYNSYNTTPINTLRYVLANTRTTSAVGPTDVLGGTPFTVQFNMNTNEAIFPGVNADGRIELVFDLPAGVSLNTTAGFFRLNNGTMVPVTAIQTGNTVTVTSNYTNSSNNVHAFFLDFIVTCPAASFTLPYKFNYYSVTCPTIKVQMRCGTYGSVNVKCPCSSPDGGVSNGIATAERTSLGFTDATMTTKVTPASIPARSLKRLLPNDEAVIKLTGTQIVPVDYDNLYLNVTFGRKNATEGYLTILGGTVVITDASTSNTYTVNLPAATPVITSTSETHNYSLTGLLPAGYVFQPGDKYEMNLKVKYTGASPAAAEFVLPGADLHFYNLNSTGVKMTCGGSAVELYLIPIITQSATYFGQSSLGSGCNGGILQGSYRQSLPTEADPYPSEFRPAAFIDELIINLPPGFTFDSSRANVLSAHNFAGTGMTTQLPPTPIVNGNTVRYVNDGTWNIADQQNSPSTSWAFYMPVVATCAANTGTNTIPGFQLKVRPRYYAYSNIPTPPSIPDATYTQQTYTSASTNRDYANKPAITISNLSGTIQASKTIESVRLRVSSTGQSAANNVWLAVLNNPGITIVDVVDLSTNTSVLSTGQTYSAGTWYKAVSSLSPSASRDFRIDFTYTSCTQSNIVVSSGWDCSGYPTDPSTYPCTASTANLPFTPIPGAVQVQTINEPATPLSGLCGPLNYVFRLNSAGGSNLKDVKFAITQISGVTVTPSTIQAEYPEGSGNWSAVSYTTSGNDILLDLTTHPAYPATGLPGTLNDGGNANNRLIGVRFSITTDCNFVSGSNFTVTTFAKNTCGSDTNGSGSTVATGSLSVSGANPSYLVDSTISVNPATDFDNCASPINLPIEQTITSVNPTGSTGTVRIDLPLGYEFVAPVVISCTSTFCPTVDGVYTDAVTGTKYMVLKVPAGMNSGDKLIYTVQIKNSAIPITCGDHTISIKTFDKSGSISCPSAPGGTCTDVTLQTGKFDLNFSIKKPTYSIDVLSGVLSGGTFAGSVKISNTSVNNSTNPISITFYCADAAGNPTSTVFGTATIATPVAAGANATYTYSFTPAATCNSGKVYAVIKTTSNCVCADSNGYILQLLCYKPAATTGGTVLDTNHGITALGRAGDNDNWPMVRKGAWTVLESKEKGFVVNRVPTTAALANITNPVIGMTVYDIEAKCLKIYSVKEGDTNANWHCFNMQTCPD